MLLSTFAVISFMDGFLPSAYSTHPTYYLLQSLYTLLNQLMSSTSHMHDQPTTSVLPLKQEQLYQCALLSKYQEPRSLAWDWNQMQCAESVTLIKHSGENIHSHCRNNGSLMLVLIILNNIQELSLHPIDEHHGLLCGTAGGRSSSPASLSGFGGFLWVHQVSPTLHWHNYSDKLAVFLCEHVQNYR